MAATDAHAVFFQRPVRAIDTHKKWTRIRKGAPSLRRRTARKHLFGGVESSDSARKPAMQRISCRPICKRPVVAKIHIPDLAIAIAPLGFSCSCFDVHCDV